MAKCTGGNWWKCADHIYNNCWLENCTIYDDNTGYLTYKGNWQLIPVFDRVTWINQIITELEVMNFELVDGIGQDKRKTVAQKLRKQLDYLRPAFEKDKREYQEAIGSLTSGG